jgi:putative transposase
MRLQRVGAVRPGIGWMRPVLRRKAALMEVPRDQRFAGRPEIRAALPVAKLQSKSQRNSAIRMAYLRHGYTLSQIGAHLGLHYTTVSKVVNQVRPAK